MNRRSILRGMITVGAVAAILKGRHLSDAPAEWAGLAPVKREGAVIAMDPAVPGSDRAGYAVFYGDLVRVFESEGDMYEAITGCRSAVLDGSDRCCSQRAES